LSQASLEYEHPFTQVRDDVKRVGYIIVATDRGLCGGLNNNMFRKLLGEFKQWQDQGVEITTVIIGKKAAQFFKRLNVHVSASTQDLGDQPQLESLIGSIKVVLDDYRDEKLDRLYVCYNEFVNTMTQKSRFDQLLPLPAIEDETADQSNWDYLYEPSAEALLDDFLTRYIESIVYQATLENVASEHAARMVAMKSASDNANNLIDDLRLAYNKARQAAITQEISEIVGGASAV